MSAAADRIRIEQEKLNEIRAEAARRMQKEWEDIQDKARARLDAGRDGGLDEGKADDQRRADAQRKIDQDDRAQRFEDQAKRDQAHKQEQQKSDDQRQSDQRKADQQKKDDQRQEDIRAEARAKARNETEKLVKEGLKRHVSDRQERIMAGSSTGPAMTPATVGDPIAMAAAIDHPGLTDDQKLILHNYGYAIGDGWHNREAEQKEQLMQGERQKRDDLQKTFRDREKEGPQTDHPDFFEDIFKKRDEPAPERSTPEQRHADAVQERDQAVSDVKENTRTDHEDQQIGETVQDKGERANLESTGKVTVGQAEEVTHGKGSKEHADQQFEKWFERHEDKELQDAGVSRDPADYEREDER